MVNWLFKNFHSIEENSVLLKLKKKNSAIVFSVEFVFFSFVFEIVTIFINTLLCNLTIIHEMICHFYSNCIIHSLFRVLKKISDA